MSIEHSEYSAGDSSVRQRIAIARLRQGDPRQWQETFTALHPRLVRYGDRLIPGQGEDFAQGAWLSLWQGLQRPEAVREDTEPVAYLSRTVFRRAMDEHRRTKRLAINVGDDPRVLFDNRPSPDVPVDDQAIAESAETIFERHGIHNTTEKQIAVLTALGFDGEEIGQILKKKAGAVRVARHRMVQGVKRRNATD